jgi:hypothetical protein
MNRMSVCARWLAARGVMTAYIGSAQVILVRSGKPGKTQIFFQKGVFFLVRWLVARAGARNRLLLDH